MGVQERKEREREQRRAAIVDAAEDVFFSQGFEHATMESIANASELSKGTIYLYFNNKTELCLAIVYRALEKLRENLTACMLKNYNGLHKFESIIDIFLEFTTENPSYYQALLNYRYHLYSCSSCEDVIAEITSENEKINDIIITIINNGIEDGSISGDIDPELLSSAIWGNQTGILPSCILQRSGIVPVSEPRKIIRYLFDLIINSMINKEERR